MALNYKFTWEEMVARTAPYFASNPEAAAFIVTTHDGKIYRTEFESYAQHAAAKGSGETVVIYREAHLVPRPLSAEDAMAEAGLVLVPVNSTDHPLVSGVLVPAEKVLPPTLAELVASATRFTFPATEPAPAAPVTESAPAPATEPAPAKPAARRGRKPATTPATEPAPAKPATRRGRKPATEPAPAAAEEKKPSTTKKAK